MDNNVQRANELLNIGAEAYRKGDYVTAQDYYTQAAKLGNVQAICNLGYIYEYGRTGKRDYKRLSIVLRKLQIVVVQKLAIKLAIFIFMGMQERRIMV